MIYLNNSQSNTFYPTFFEGSLSGTSQYLINLKSDSTNREFYFVASATTSNNRYDTITLDLVQTGSTYFNSIPNQTEGFFYYKAYELYSGLTGITITELTGNTIDISTACTSNEVVQEGKLYISGTTSLNEITKTYSGTSSNYTYYK